MADRLPIARRPTSAPPAQCFPAWRTAVCTAILATAVSCANAEPAPRSEAAPTPSERIAELQAAIAEDHTTLEALITQPREEAEEPLYADPTLRAISRRLGEQERELAALLETESKHGPGGTTR